MAEVGYAANRRLLDAECISHDPADGAAALEALTSPVISTTCTRIPGMRFPDPRVQALLGACCALALRPAGFTSRDLRHYLAPQLGKTPEDMTSGQISYDLRRLRAHQIIQRIPHSRSLPGHRRRPVHRPVPHPPDPGGSSSRHSPSSPAPDHAGRSPLRQADRAYRAAIDRPRRQASLARLTPPAIRHQSQSRAGISRHTRRNLTRKVKIPAGKDNLRPPRRDPSPKVDDRLFGNFDMKRPNGWIRVHGSSAGAHDLCPFSRVEDDSVDGLPACGHSAPFCAFPAGCGTRT